MNNDNRANSIAAILPDFKVAAGLRGEPAPEVIGDLLCNLAHWCDAEECDFAIALDRAILNYEAETRNSGLQFEEIAGAFRDARKSRLALWTVTVEHDGDNSPFTDLLYSAEEPTVAQVKEVHEHLREYADAQFDIQEYRSIPSVK